MRLRAASVPVSECLYSVPYVACRALGARGKLEYAPWSLADTQVPAVCFYTLKHFPLRFSRFHAVQFRLCMFVWWHWRRYCAADMRMPSCTFDMNKGVLLFWSMLSL